MTFTTLGFLQNIGGPELIIILVVALLIFGSRLPSTARSLGKSINEFKRGMKEGEEGDVTTAEKEAPKTDVNAPEAKPS
jgi:sec-independent protein translocase protein TatA